MIGLISIAFASVGGFLLGFFLYGPIIRKLHKMDFQHRAYDTLADDKRFTRGGIALLTWPADRQWLGRVVGKTSGWGDLIEIESIDGHYYGGVYVPARCVYQLPKRDNDHWTLDEAIQYHESHESLTGQHDPC